MKKYFIVLLLSVFVIAGCSLKDLKGKIEDITDKYPLDGISIMQLDKYKDFSIDNVKSLNILRYTVAGIDEEKVDDFDQIKREFNAISKIKVGSETTRACEDNTTIYEFITNDNNKVSFEFECEWLVIGNKRYNIDK